jgi:hypothetical protein
VKRLIRQSQFSRTDHANEDAVVLFLAIDAGRAITGGKILADRGSAHFSSKSGGALSL